VNLKTVQFGSTAWFNDEIVTNVLSRLVTVFRIRIYRIHMFLGLLDPDPDPLVRGMDPDPSIVMQK
jgi:hypothetical protein